MKKLVNESLSSQVRIHYSQNQVTGIHTETEELHMSKTALEQNTASEIVRMCKPPLICRQLFGGHSTNQKE